LIRASRRSYPFAGIGCVRFLSCGRVKPAFAIAATIADRLEFVMDLTTCENPIFIIESPRSGTSILAWSLAEQSQLEVFAESNFLDLPD
jgi:hypothetical protein